MLKKVLFLGLSFAFAVLGLFTTVDNEKSHQDTLVSKEDKKDDGIERKPETGDGIFYLSVDAFNLK